MVVAVRGDPAHRPWRTTDAGGGNPRPLSRAQGMVLLAGLVSVVLSVGVLLLDIDPDVGTRRLHVSLETADALVLVVLAAVLFGRYRTDGSRRNLLLVAAVVVIAVKSLLFAGYAMFTQDRAGNVPIVLGNDSIVWSTATNGVLGAILLALAATLPDHRLTRLRLAGNSVILGSAATVLLVTVVAELADPVFPPAFPSLLADSTSLDVFSGHPLKILVDFATAAGYLVAALGFTRLADRYHDEFMIWLAIGAVTASAAFVNYALIPSRFTELLYGGEVLWLCAVLALLFGAVREISSLEAALVRSAVMAERKRVARDLHDGVVQELAYISTQAAWLSTRVTGTDYATSVGRISAAVDRALDESRGAIAALNRSLDEPVGQAVSHAAGEVAERLGARLELAVDNHLEVPGEWRDALIRIAREAVGNAVRHGGASAVRLTLRRTDAVRLEIVDDGSGFDLSAPRSPQSFGLRSMRERAESHGGTLVVDTAPGRGTRVTVTLPGRPGSH